MRTSDDSLCSLEEPRASTPPVKPVQTFDVRRSALHVWTPSGAVRTSVTLLGQDIGNTRNSLDLVHDLILSSANWYRATKWRPDLSIIAPGRWVARMPGTGTLRRSNTPARKKAIVGKSRVAATRLQGATRISFSPRWWSWFLTAPGTLGNRPPGDQGVRAGVGQTRSPVGPFQSFGALPANPQAPGEEYLLFLP